MALRRRQHDEPAGGRFQMRDTYGDEVRSAADVVLVLAVTVAVDALAHD